MLDIIDELKNIYRNDVFPVVDTVTPKDLVIYFPALDLTIETDQIVDDSFELSENLCSEPDLVFGSCEASKIKFTVADVEQDITGQWFTIEQVIDGFDPVPLGVYKVDSCVKQDNLRFKDITAYDKLKDTDINVADWYNSLFSTGDETYTLKQFRESLLAYLGIEYEDEILPNDDAVIEKTIEPTRISGREVLRRCVELNGAFGHIGRTGKLRHVVLEPTYGLYPAGNLFPSEDLLPVSEDDKDFEYDYSNTGLYPSELLYPSEDFYPIYETDPNPFPNKENVGRYQRIDYEGYTANEIDKLIIRSDEDDIGAIVGSGSNAYIIQGNFLVFGKSAEELKQIASNAYSNIAKRPYRPFVAECIGLPYIEVGDSIEFATDDKVKSYVLQRTLTGIQALKDVFEALGSEEREQNFGVNEEIIQLKGRATRIKKDVEGVRVEVENLEERTNTRFEITDNKITQEVNRATQAEEDLSGRIEVQADRITQEVTRATEAEGELSGRIDVQADRITQEVTRATEAEGELSGRIDVLAGQIILKVDANGNVAAVELNADPSEGSTIKWKADNLILEGLVTANGYFKILEDGSIEAVNGRFSGELVAASGTFTGTLNGVDGTFTGTLNGVDGTFIGTLNGNEIVAPNINGGTILGSHIIVSNSLGVLDIDGPYIQGRNNFGTLKLEIDYNGNIKCSSLTIDGASPITTDNIASQSVSYASIAGYTTTASFSYGAYALRNSENSPNAAYISSNNNFRPVISGDPSCGTAEGLWSSVWAVNGTIQTSDEREKTNINILEEDKRFLKFVKMIVPYTYKMLRGTSGRKHTGFIAQRIEEAMTECGISSMEFAGLIKAPVYAEKLKDDNGNELSEYDTESDIIDYTYHLRYEEFIPLIFLWLKEIESKLS